MKARQGSQARWALAAIGVSVAMLAGPSFAQTVRGVTATEIVIGTVTDLSGVTAVQGVNNSDAIRMAFDEANAKGGLYGRKIKYIVEDSQYTVPRAVQAMNKLLNSDNIFLALDDGGTPMNDANMPAQFEKNVPNMFPLTSARSMYQPYNKLKFSQFASYYDQMRSAVKYFAQVRHRSKICAMYQDSDFGRDVHAGVVAQLQAMGLKLAGKTSHKPTDTDFNGPLAKLRDANCDLICLGTIVKDTTLIVQTARKMGWDVTFVGQFASYSTAVAEAPGGPAEGFYSMSPGLYAYPDDPRPAVHALGAKYKQTYGFEINYLGETGISAAMFVSDVLRKAGRNLTVDSFIAAMESMKDWQDIFGSPPLTLSASNHHASSQSFLSMIKEARWVPVVQQPLSF